MNIDRLTDLANEIAAEHEDKQDLAVVLFPWDMGSYKVAADCDLEVFSGDTFFYFVFCDLLVDLAAQDAVNAFKNADLSDDEIAKRVDDRIVAYFDKVSVVSRSKGYDGFLETYADEISTLEIDWKPMIDNATSRDQSIIMALID